MTVTQFLFLRPDVCGSARPAVCGLFMNMECVFCFVFLVTSLQTSVSVTESTEDVVGKVGENVVLNCVFPSGTDLTFQWTHFSKCIMIFRSEHSEKCESDDFEHRIYLLDSKVNNGNGSLILQKITHGDSGNYTCAGTVTTSTVTVKDSVTRHKRDTKPVIQDFTNNIRLTVRSSSEGLIVGILLCIVLVILGAGIAYYKRVQKVAESGRNLSLSY